MQAYVYGVSTHLNHRHESNKAFSNCQNFILLFGRTKRTACTQFKNTICCLFEAIQIYIVEKGYFYLYPFVSTKDCVILQLLILII